MVESVFLLGLQNTSDDFPNQSLEEFYEELAGARRITSYDIYENRKEIPACSRSYRWESQELNSDFRVLNPAPKHHQLCELLCFSFGGGFEMSGD